MKTGYYGCGGYIAKGTSVCQLSIVRQETIEGFLFEEIGKGLRRFLDGKEGRKALRKALMELMGPDNSAGDNRRERLLAKKNEIEGKIYNIIDSMTPTTKEFADKRVGQLKDELEDVQVELDRIAEDTARRVDVDSLIPQLLDYMGNIGTVVAEGTVDEKRRFLRAFIRRVELDPKTGTGRAEIYDLPVFSVQEKKDSRNGRPSSFQVVAGARYVVEKKIPGRRVEFVCFDEALEVLRRNAILLAA